MEDNPYQSPRSDVAIDEQVKRSLWWKIYFFFITVISAFGMLTFLIEPDVGVSEYVLLIVWLIATVGFFGFVFLKPIYKPSFWFQVLVVYVAYSIVYYFVTDVDLRAGMSDAEFYISTAVGWLLSLPAFYALYAYSKLADPAWNRYNQGQGRK